MLRLTMLGRAISLCLLFHAFQTEGIRLHHTINQLKNNDSRALDSVDGPTKQNMISLNSNLIMVTSSRQDSSSYDEPCFAVHQTTPRGPGNNYYGFHATMDVYGHELKPGQGSSTGIWVNHNGNGVTSVLNAISVGWHIYPDHYGDSHPHFYTHWTRDGYKETGCINMDCPGFVRANGAVIAPGAVIHPVSDVPEGHIQNITLKVLKDKTSGDWWVYYGFNTIPTGVGYFPNSLFTYLAEKANQVAFGAYVINDKTLPTPPMGSGALPNGGQGRAASFTNLRFIDQDGNSSPITADLPELVTEEKCHSITPIDNAECFYGGPGGCVK
uniref:Uncharacterized protein n=1 Tax=Avena sativa TaxID=4498 RepID=A0ACD5WF71_AVESA